MRGRRSAAVAGVVVAGHGLVVLHDRLGRNPVRAAGPAREIEELAAFAAEGTPRVDDGARAAEDAELWGIHVRIIGRGPRFQPYRRTVVVADSAG